eukprot:gnl/TRDRNA2_/TRDRNA2_119184_c0_seq1.p1 gnl/TRDRNA2_/TRDRNA2_119184_c0~~gnl/TRDRNA2_/TRDRNA2_119184_c0_seq1.p1  ORF type:complete len:558 (-),score=102.68 gnl/TRDRNA2_/TRDRNA2_119184_c0_seq1:98-1540(-)
MCTVEVAPWPVHADGNATPEADALASAIVTLCEDDEDEEFVVGGTQCKVFPPYDECLEQVVEDEFRASSSNNLLEDLEQWLQKAQSEAEASGEALSLPLILALAAQAQVTRDKPGGALLWCWEKLTARGGRRQRASENYAQAAPSRQDGHVPRPSMSSGGPPGLEDIASKRARAAASSAGANRQVGEAETSKASKSVPGDAAAGVSEGEDDADAAGSDASGEASPSRKPKEPDGESMTPAEAFISCFNDDLKENQVLFLSQLNNIYRMRSGGHEINYKGHGFGRMSEFLVEIPGLELVGTSNKMAVKIRNASLYTSYAILIMQGLHQRINDLRSKGVDTRGLELAYQKPRTVPKRLLERLWDLFQTAKDNEIPVSCFVAVYNDQFFDKLQFKALGYADVRGLMAQVPFLEKVGGRKDARYRLKAGAQPPDTHWSVNASARKGRGKDASKSSFNARPVPRPTPSTRVEPRIESQPASKVGV